MPSSSTSFPILVFVLLQFLVNINCRALSGPCGAVNTVTNSWQNNVQGTIKIVVPEDITEYTIQLQTDIPLTDIQVNFW